MIYAINVSKEALQQLKRTPKHVARKFLAWTSAVQSEGLEQVRKVPGYNDHPLHGKLEGKRAVRLSYLWRAIYVINRENEVELVLVEEISPHDY